MIMFLILGASGPVRAGCPNPSEPGGQSPEGAVVYNADYNVVQFCDGATWYALGKNNPDASDGTCSGPEGVEGEVLYNQAYHIPQFCNGEEWIAMRLEGGTDDEAGTAGLSLSAATYHTCAIKQPTHSIWCWGDYEYGKLGIGTVSAIQLTPVEVSDPGPWVSVTASTQHTCGIKADRSAWCWGQGTTGQLGNGSTSDQWTPVEVSGGGKWKMISPGEFHTCGIKDDGSAWCWGTASNGRLGNGVTSGIYDSPVPVSGSGEWHHISAGGSHTCGIDTSGAAFCWGRGTLGRLGTGGTSSQSTPTAITETGPWSQIEVGYEHSCALKSDGTIWCWGNGGEGRLGNGDTSDQSNPVKVSGSHVWTDVEAAAWHSCGMTDDHAIWCWGNNGNGRLGDGTTTHRSTPIAITESGPWSVVSAHNDAHTCGLKNDSTIWCWGWGDAGQLGIGYTYWGIFDPEEIVDPGPWNAVGLCTEPDRPEGALLYNSGYRVMQYCDGANWIAIGK